MEEKWDVKHKRRERKRVEQGKRWRVSPPPLFGKNMRKTVLALALASSLCIQINLFEKIKSLTRRRTSYRKKRDGKKRQRKKKRKTESEPQRAHTCAFYPALISALNFRIFSKSKKPLSFYLVRSLLEDLALDVLEAVDLRLLGEHVLDALLLLGVGDVDLGPVVEVEVVALLSSLFLCVCFFEGGKKVSFFFFSMVVQRERERDVPSPAPAALGAPLLLLRKRILNKEKQEKKNYSSPRPSSAGSPARGRSTRRGSGTGPCRP